MEVKTGYQRTDVGVIPKDWSDGDLGDLYPYITSGSRGYAKYYSEKGAPFIRITNLSRESIDLDLSDLKFVDLPVGASDSERTQLQTNDVLISITADIGIIGHVNDSVDKPAYMNQHIALVRFNPNNAHSRFISYYLASENAQKHFGSSKDLGAKAGMNLLTVRKIRIPRPPLPEQRTIATVLSDVDALITSLEHIIAKKRDIKQAAMQDLFTGKRRLPGFSGDWEIKQLGDVSAIKTGKKNNEDKVEDGQYPFFVRSQTVERINTYSYEGEAILMPGEGGIGSIIHYINGKFDYHQRVYKISDFSSGICGKFIYYCMLLTFNKQAMRNSVKATVDSLRLPTFKEFEFITPELKEQQAIAITLSDIDSDLTALEQKRDKTKAIKQGMMQELLTGRIRLV